MSKYKKITILILIFFLAIPSVSLGGSFVVSLIQGKTPAEAVQIIAEQIDSLFGRVQTLETQQIATDQSIVQANLEIERLKLENENLKLKSESLTKEQNKQWCDLSFKEVPRTFSIPVYVGGLSENIVRYYTMSKFVIDNNLDFNQKRLSEWQKLVNESKSSYTEFIEKCPNYPTNEISIKAQWCISTEPIAKCYQLYGAGHRPASEMEQFLGAKYLEFSCDQLLNEEAPNRDKYTCG